LPSAATLRIYRATGLGNARHGRDLRPDPTGRARGGAAGADIIKDGDQRTFMKDVVEASREVPVLVDFWATWCGPCKALTPTLEKVVKAAQGRVRLVKIDIDKNKQLVQQLAQMGLPLQSVPTVVGFVQGQIADLFQGALSEAEVKKFIEALLKMGGGQLPGADLLAEAKAAVEAGDHQGALNLFAALAEAEPENPDAFAGLARTLMALGEEEQAQQVLDEVPPKLHDHARSPPSAPRCSSRSRGERRRRSSASSSGGWRRMPTTTPPASTWPSR
jgi:putative thioredoxin